MYNILWAIYKWKCGLSLLLLIFCMWISEIIEKMMSLDSTTQHRESIRYK